MNRILTQILLAILTLVIVSSSDADELRMVAWNVESGGIVRSKIGEQLRQFEGVDLWVLSEVQAVNADFFIANTGEGETGSFTGLIGTTGGADRLLIVFDESRLQFIEGFELEELALGGAGAFSGSFKNDRWY